MPRPYQNKPIHFSSSTPHLLSLRRGWGRGVAVERHKQGREKFYRSRFGQELYNNDLKIERLLRYSPVGGVERRASQCRRIINRKMHIRSN